MIVKYWNQVSDIWNICSISQITVHAVNLVLEHLGHVVLVFTQIAQKRLQGVHWLLCTEAFAICHVAFCLLLELFGLFDSSFSRLGVTNSNLADILILTIYFGNLVIWLFGILVIW